MRTLPRNQLAASPRFSGAIPGIFRCGRPPQLQQPDKGQEDQTRRGRPTLPWKRSSATLPLPQPGSQLPRPRFLLLLRGGSAVPPGDSVAAPQVRQLLRAGPLLERALRAGTAVHVPREGGRLPPPLPVPVSPQRQGLGDDLRLLLLSLGSGGGEGGHPDQGLRPGGSSVRGGLGAAPELHPERKASPEPAEEDKSRPRDLPLLGLPGRHPKGLRRESGGGAADIPPAQRRGAAEVRQREPRHEGVGGDESAGSRGRARDLSPVHLRLRGPGPLRGKALDSREAPGRDRAGACLRARGVARSLLPLPAEVRLQRE